MPYQATSFTLKDRNQTYQKIRDYLTNNGFEEIGDNFIRKVFGSDLATVIVDYDINEFTTRVDVGTSHPEFLDELQTKFPQLRLKSWRV